MIAYQQLLDHAARELELVRGGRLDELPAIQAERARLQATLPAAPPSGAQPLLQRTAALQAEIVATLAEARDATGQELTRLHRGRGAVRAYGHVGARQVGAADRRA